MKDFGLALKVTDYLSVGAGLDIMYLQFQMKRVLPLPFLGPQSLDLQGDSWGLGFNLGVLVKPTDYLSVGVSYRSQVRQHVAGKFLRQNLADGGHSLKLTWWLVYAHNMPRG